MRKVWCFTLQEQNIRVVYSWIHGVKLYVDGDLRDHYPYASILNPSVKLCTQLNDWDQLHIIPYIGWATAEICVYLNNNDTLMLLFNSQASIQWHYAPIKSAL